MNSRKKSLKFELLEARYLLAANPIIAEFLASNDNGLEDGNGSRSDWIEIYNNGDQSVNLAGYRLTDDPTNTSKWIFPSANLAAGEYLVVFASGNNTPDSAGYLHTNFALGADGEYVALINPSGTVLSEFGAGGSNYPAQTSDVSYGLAYDYSVDAAVNPNSASKYRIPTNGALDSTWMNLGFNDAAWQSGTVSIGFENTPADYAGLIQTAVPTGTATVYVRTTFTVSNSDALLGRLQMKYDDGFIAYINGTRVASANAPGVGVFNSVATGDHPDGLAVEYVDFDISEFSNLLNVGENVLAIQLLNTSGSSSDLLGVPNLLVTSGGIFSPYVEGVLESPTPELPNTNLRAADVVFSRGGGVFAAPFQLTLTSDSAETIRYTTDGSIPNETSLLYTQPITINSTVQIRAKSFGPIGQAGPIKTETFVLSQAAVVSFNSNLPVIVLENFGQGVPDREFQDSTFALYDVDPVTGRSSLSNPADFTSLIGQHQRGKSTFGQPKYNLRIELRDDFGEDQSSSLLGLPSESDWILYAPWTIDRAMIRNALVYELGRQTGRWSPRTRFVEVYSNTDSGVLNQNDYLGVYVLMEVIKRDGERVDIEELTPSQNSPPDITGGYILQIDEPVPDDGGWNTSRGYPTGGSQFTHSEPERNDLTIAQRDYIRDYVQDAEDALFGPNSTDPNLGYAAYFDVAAAIDYHIMNVFPANPDAFRLSTYLTKDRGGKLEFGPLWDFDRGMGADGESRTADPTKWMTDQGYFWVTQYWGKFFQDPDFEQLWADRWQELRDTVLSDSNVETTLLSLSNQLTEAQARNYARWPGTAPDGGPLADPGLPAWEGEISHLKNWLLDRVHWIDTRVVRRPAFNVPPGDVDENTQIALSAPGTSAIYYTLNGTDPRADGGAVAAGAILYSGPITVGQSTQINARAFGSAEIGNWSGMKTGLFLVDAPATSTSLRVTEVHYHPADPTPGELAVVPGVEDNDFEFIELQNISDSTISLNGVRFIQGITFNFTTSNVTSLAPGQVVVVAGHQAAFEARYGTGILVAGEFGGNLSNSGEQLILWDVNSAVIQDFTFPDAANGDGPSLEVISTAGDYSSPANWRASSAANGTPGAVVGLPGDYDGNGTVEQADYLVWKSTFGSTTDLRADGNDDQVVDAADYSVWRNNLEAPGAAALQSGLAVGSGQSSLAEAASSLAASAESAIDGAMEAYEAKSAIANAAGTYDWLASRPAGNRSEGSSDARSPRPFRFAHQARHDDALLNVVRRRSAEGDGPQGTRACPVTAPNSPDQHHQSLDAGIAAAFDESEPIANLL